jgi:hypothetical protein
VEPGPGGGGEQPHLGVGQDPVTAERAAEQAGRHDGHALGVQAAAMDVGAMHAQQPDRPGAKDAADDLSFPADRLQRPVQPVVVVPCQPVGALSRRRNQPALRPATCSAAAWWLVRACWRACSARAARMVASRNSRERSGGDWALCWASRSRSARSWRVDNLRTSTT